MKILILSMMPDGAGGGTIANRIMYSAFRRNSWWSDCDASFKEYKEEIDKEFLKGFDYIHFPTLGTIKERYSCEQTKARINRLIYEVRSSNVPFGVDLRAPWELEIYPISKHFLGLDNCKVVFTISEKLKDFYRERITRNIPIFVIDQFQEQLPVIYPKTDSVYSVARISPSKNVHEFAKYSNKIEIPCFIYGSYTGHDDYFNFVMNLKSQECVYGGGFENEKVFSIIRHAKYLVDFSLYENDGERPQFTVLEAMANGTIPVVLRQWESKKFKAIVLDDFSELPEKIRIAEEDRRYRENIIRFNFMALERDYNPKNATILYISAIKEVTRGGR